MIFALSSLNVEKEGRESAPCGLYSVTIFEYRASGCNLFGSVTGTLPDKVVVYNKSIDNYVESRNKMLKKSLSTCV
jgi:hypothetical protein